MKITKKFDAKGNVISVGTEIEDHQIPDLLQELDNLGVEFQEGDKEFIQLYGPPSDLPKA